MTDEQKTMKALRMVGVGQPLEMQEVPAPTIDHEDPRDNNQAVIRVRACGVCGTDVHHLAGTAKVSDLPVTLGHEVAGIIEEVGKAVSGGWLGLPEFKAGDRVTVHNVVYCGECRPCRRGRYNFCTHQSMIGRDVDGGLAEYMKVPARNLVPLPANITFPEGAILGCAVVTAYHALRIAHIKVSDSVVVWGVGGVGLSLVQLARQVSGAYPIIAIGNREEPLLLARELGADVVVDVRKDNPVEAILESSSGEGADVVFDTVGVTDPGSNGTLQTLQSTCPGGQLIVIATYEEAVRLQPHDELGIFEKRFTGSCGNLPDELQQLTRLVAGRRRLDLMKIIAKIISPGEVNEVLDEWRTEGGITRAVVSF